MKKQKDNDDLIDKKHEGLMAAIVLGLMIIGSLFWLQFYFDCPQPSCPEPICPVANLTCEAPLVSCPEAPDLTCAEIPDCTCNPVNTWSVKKTFTSHLHEVASSVAIEREHSGKEEWDCDDMADAGEERLRNAGFDCRRVDGWYYQYAWRVNDNDEPEQYLVDKTRHAWVECDDVIVDAVLEENTIVHAEDYHKYKK